MKIKIVLFIYLVTLTAYSGFSQVEGKLIELKIKAGIHLFGYVFASKNGVP